MRSVPRIPRTAIDRYIEKFKPNFPRGTVKNRLKNAIANLDSNRFSTGGRSYAQITIGNGHDARLYVGVEGNEVVDILTKQEYGEQYRPR